MVSVGSTPETADEMSGVDEKAEGAPEASSEDDAIPSQDEDSVSRTSEDGDHHGPETPIDEHPDTESGHAPDTHIAESDTGPSEDPSKVPGHADGSGGDADTATAPEETSGADDEEAPFTDGEDI